MFIQKKLASGPTLIAEKLPNFHSVTIGIWVGAGSVTETQQENGISHFIEHMLFKGTQKRSAKQIAIDVDNIGGQINAFTGKEATCYYIKVLDEKMQSGIEILSDLFCNATLDAEELEKEKGVVLEEIAMSNDNPEDVAMDLISATFYKGCSLQKTILGPQENIKSFTRDDLVSYMDRYYTSENIVVAVAGNFDEEELCECLNKNLTNIKNTKLKLPEFVRCADYAYTKGFEIEKKDIEQVHICMGMPSYSIQSNNRHALNILNNVIGGSMSSRLFQKIREEMGMAYSVFTHPVMHKDTGMYSVYAGTMAQNAQIVSELILDEFKKIVEEGISEEEFLQSKEQLKGNLMLSLESTAAKMNSIGKAMLLLGRVRTDEEVLELINAVTLQDIKNVIEEVICLPKMTATFVGTIKEQDSLAKLFA